MQLFSTQLGRAGGAAGAAGGGLLGQLGQFLEPLDYPRQALWNLGGSLGKAVTGQGEWDDVLKALPGALGVGAGALAMAIPGAMPFGLGMMGMGNLVGGVAQGVGKMADSEKFEAPKVSDLTGTEDMLPNMLVGALTDPMSFGGFTGGAKAGGKFGGWLDVGAAQRGPQYAGGLEKLHAATAVNPAYRAQLAAEQAAGKTHLMEHMANIRANPEAMAELAPGSKYLGSGVETMAFRHPEGHVVTYRRNNPRFTEQYAPSLDTVPPRPQIEEMMQPVRSKLYGEGPSSLRVEHMPMAETIPSGLSDPETMGYMFGSSIHPASVEKGMLTAALRGKGYHVPDLHYGNLGEAFGGGVQAIDPGAVWAGTSSLPLGPEVSGAARQGGFRNWLLDLLGGPESYQKQLAHMAGDPEAYAQASQRALAAPPSGFLAGGKGKNVLMGPQQLRGTMPEIAPSLSDLEQLMSTVNQRRSV